MILLSTSTGSLTPLTVLCAPLPTTTSSDELVLHSSLVLTVGEQVGTGKAWGDNNL